MGLVSALTESGGPVVRRDGPALRSRTPVRGETCGVGSVAVSLTRKRCCGSRYHPVVLPRRPPAPRRRPPVRSGPAPAPDEGALNPPGTSLGGPTVGVPGPDGVGRPAPGPPAEPGPGPEPEAGFEPASVPVPRPVPGPLLAAVSVSSPLPAPASVPVSVGVTGARGAGGADRFSTRAWGSNAAQAAQTSLSVHTWPTAGSCRSTRTTVPAQATRVPSCSAHC